MANNGDNLKKVKVGDPLQVSASTFNSLIDAALTIKQQQQSVGGGMIPDLHRSTIVWIRNDSGEDREALHVLGIESPVYGPDDNLEEFKYRFSLVGSKPSINSHVGKFAVLLEPIAPDKIGLACISGGVPVKINVLKDWHTRADVEDDNPANLVSDMTGSAQILWKEAGCGVKWAIVKIGLPFDREFFARITKTTSIGANQWEYEFIEVEKQVSGYGGWADKVPGRSGIAFNTIEDPNDGSGIEGNGVDLSTLDGPEMWPAGEDAIVKMREVKYSLDCGPASIEYWFQFENQVTFRCDCSSCCCSSSSSGSGGSGGPFV